MSGAATERQFVILEDRGILAVTGADARPFLQGLISNDIDRVAADRASYAAFLTAQGKYLHDFFVAEHGEALLLDCEAERRADLERRLRIYRLRSDVTIADRTDDLAVAVAFGPGAVTALGLTVEDAGAAVPFAGGVAFADPRLAAAGARIVLPRADAEARLREAGLAPAAREDYDRLRIGLGLPDGSRDMVVEKAILLENGFDELHGVDWDKGCFLGQELTARTKYRALIKRRLVPVAVEGPNPAPGSPVLLDGAEAGEIRSAVDGLALALLRLDHLARAEETGATLVAGDARLTPRKPDWVAF